MKEDLLKETIAANICRAICAEGALGSPFALHRLSRAIGSLSQDGAALAIAGGVAHLTEVCRALFVSRNDRFEYAALRAVETAEVHTQPDLFRLTCQAIAKAVFRHDWDGSAALFDLAARQAATFHSPFVGSAVIGLKERYVLLPQTGTGVRESGAPQDILRILNHAESLFCRGDLLAARNAAEGVVTAFPAFGWARVLLIRICFVQGDAQGARAILLNSQLGSIGATEELAWDALIPGADRSWATSTPGKAHFRLPNYFKALNSLVKGDVHTGLGLLKRAARAGEPAAYMAGHDPVVKFFLGSAYAKGIPFPFTDTAELRISSE
jgi:hypothetical protein